jgi:hemerythrin-like domain-containing protein
MINPFLKILYDEHIIIVNAIDVAKQAKPLIGKEDVLYEKTVRQLIGFFRDYADKYHHYKEENILFPEMNRRNELLEDGMIKEMFDNHEDFREMIRSIEKNLDVKNFSGTQTELEKYGEALLDHIAVENEEVFQMAETLINENELEKIGHRFLDCDRELGDDKKAEWQDLIDVLRSRLFAHQ